MSVESAEYENIVQAAIPELRNVREKINKHEEWADKEIDTIKQAQENIKPEHKTQLHYLESIKEYLLRALGEYPKITIANQDINKLYNDELENILRHEQSLRLDFRTEIYERVTTNYNALKNIEKLLHPLFFQTPPEILNLNKFLMPIKKKNLEDAPESAEKIYIINSEELTKREKEASTLAQKVFDHSLNKIFELAKPTGSITLREITEHFSKSPDLQKEIFPTLYTALDILPGLFWKQDIQISDLIETSTKYPFEDDKHFNIACSLYNIATKKPKWKGLKRMEIIPFNQSDTVQIKNLPLNETSDRLFNLTHTNFKITLYFKEEP